jgi:hypothetical protein
MPKQFVRMICDQINECSIELKIPKKTLIDKKGGNSKYCIENMDRKSFYEIDFEECVYKNKQNDTKCDYGILCEQNVFYIELKGSDVKKGIKQLLATIVETKECFNGKKLKARLIVSKFPKPELIKQTKEYKDLVKIVNQNLIITQNIHTEII